MNRRFKSVFSASSIYVWGKAHSAAAETTSTAPLTNEEIERVLREHFGDQQLTIERPAFSLLHRECIFAIDTASVKATPLGDAFVEIRCVNRRGEPPFLVIAHSRFLKTVSARDGLAVQSFVKQGTLLKAVMARGKTRITIPVKSLRTCRPGSMVRVITLDKKQIFVGRLTKDLKVELQ
jgi:hypothetical protein